MHPLALRATKTCVIRGDGDPRLCKRRRHLLPPLLHKPAELPGRTVFFHYLIADVGSVEACGKNFRMRQPEARKNVPTCLLVGGGGEGTHRNLRETLLDPAQLHVLWTEIMAPLGNAVG